MVSDSQRVRRYTCENDNERLGLITAIHATTLRGSFRGTGPAPFEFGLFGGIAPGPLAATGRGGGSIRVHRPRTKRRQAEATHNFDRLALSSHSPNRH